MKHTYIRPVAKTYEILVKSGILGVSNMRTQSDDGNELIEELEIYPAGYKVVDIKRDEVW